MPHRCLDFCPIVVGLVGCNGGYGRKRVAALKPQGREYAIAILKPATLELTFIDSTYPPIFFFSEDASEVMCHDDLLYLIY
jgi:hypothetical protein